MRISRYNSGYMLHLLWSLNTGRLMAVIGKQGPTPSRPEGWSSRLEGMEAIPRSHAIALAWLAEGRRVVAATLVETVGSAPLDPGAEMLLDDRGRIEGTVTGGCVEG